MTMAFLDGLLEVFMGYLPVLMRVTSYLMTLPIWGQRVPAMTKVGLGALLTLLIAPTLDPIPVPDIWGHYALLIMAEILIGLAMGLVVAILVNAIYLAGQMIDVPLGFGMVNVLDPQTGIQVPIVAQFKFTLAMLLLFTVNGHHVLLAGLARSFTVVPVGLATFDRSAMAAVGVDAFGTMFVLALRIGIPLVAALFITDVALGIVARAVPQINVFFIGIPLKIGLGIALLALVLPLFIYIMTATFAEEGELARALNDLLQALRSP